MRKKKRKFLESYRIWLILQEKYTIIKQGKIDIRGIKMIAFEALNKDMIVFSYQTGPIMGMDGDEGGFSVCLYGNGNLKYCTYKFCEQINSMEIFKMTKEETKMIYDTIAEAEEELKRIPERLDNGSTSGSSNEFEFLGHKKIRAWNIKKSYPRAVWFTNRKYYEAYKENMIYENQVIGIFEMICRCFKKQGIELSLERCAMREDCRVRVTWKEP